ncbi:hypothetical protein ABZ883_26515 [Streptomyces sp. NPDC046977]|uniref:hypothetical protein n=1 Tax=Streptomyces sp. NPDC046977 TaxID=3154703 RepID=UPI0033EC3414
MAHGTAQHSPRVAAGLNALEGRAQRAHRLYLEHSQACDDCGHGKTRCTVATGLWVVFTEARDSER